MLNKAMIIGRLGRDPELRYTQSGVPVTTLNVATGETYIDRDGNKNEVTEWHRVSVFQRQAENCVKFLRKGSLVFVEGSLQTRKWQDQQGQDRYTTVIKALRVTFLERKSDGYRDEYEQPYQPHGEAPYGQRAPYDRQTNYGQQMAQQNQYPPYAPSNDFDNFGSSLTETPSYAGEVE
ncbi:MAG: single-stranded DNA-binding protein, partial [Desulfovibrionaceae bacterium]|nr:single-stranded DNA-binding protein [Desulfovibrionaceae bacterium]